MPLDAICLGAVRNELASQIIGIKIDKVQQPERDVVLLSLRGHGGKSFKLLISVGSGDTRVHFTEHRFDNPKVPPMFCMLLRKHLVGARIVDIVQPAAERVLIFVLETVGAMGVRSEMKMIVEMIGRQSNLILVDADGVILDCLRRVDGDLSEKRAVLPGLVYRNPPVQEGKVDPMSVTEAQFQTLINFESDDAIDKWLIKTFKALSPLICREIVWRAYGETDYRFNGISDNGNALFTAFFDLIQQVKSSEYEPWLISSVDDKPLDFSYTHIKQYESTATATRLCDFSKLLDEYYTRSAQELRMSQRSASTLKTMTTARDRLIRKLAAQRRELGETDKRDYFRECGDLITANFHLIKKGQETLIAEDFYSESGGVREIKLDVRKTPQQNSAKYYKTYTKAKNARNFLSELIENGEKELEYIESVIGQIQRVESEQDLSEIRHELSTTGYVRQSKQQKSEKQTKKQRGKSQSSKQAEISPYKFMSSSGVRILAGKNNLQNDRLTLKSANRMDIWLHAQKIHGSHVIISCAGVSPDEKTLEEAAAIAAYYSAGRSDGKVLVDYTLVKNVKRIPGGRPGMVNYRDFKTIIAVPDEDVINRLKD
ncbi:MAG: NFACT family protein [Oscillospiraceae bacterium]|nr:NFACT family protein [Oscillospiraceae bacterium]